MENTERRANIIIPNPAIMATALPTARSSNTSDVKKLRSRRPARTNWLNTYPASVIMRFLHVPALSAAHSDTQQRPAFVVAHMNVECEGRRRGSD